MNNLKKIQGLLIAGFCSFCSCMDKYLPEQMDAFDSKAGYTQTMYRPVLGRTTVFNNNFNTGSSTLPFTFEITGIMRSDGSPAPELTEFYPVTVWKTPYFGNEKSLVEIEAKRDIEYRQLFQVRKHTGEFIMWSDAKSSFVQCAPLGGYIFDVLAQNSGGYKYFTKFNLIPVREIDFEPSNTLETGNSVQEYVTPATVNQVRFEKSGEGGDGGDGFRNYYMTTEDIQVFFRNITDNQEEEKTLTFRFFGPDYQPIHPDRFNLTDWETLVHGFDMEKTGEYVRYKVAYPIPLVNLITDYTNRTGDRANVVFSWDYMPMVGYRSVASISMDFAIYTQGRWEMIFVFANGYPMF